MKILLVGSGGREHALAWKLKQSPLCDELVVVPGNAGIARLTRCHDIPVDQVERIYDFAVAEAPRPVPAPVAAPVAHTPARFDADYLHNPKPVYPPLSRRLGEEGKVLLKVRVTAQGTAEQVDIQTGSGYARLDAAARDAVLRWRFVPARRGDEPVAASVIVPITFALDG